MARTVAIGINNGDSLVVLGDEAESQSCLTLWLISQLGRAYRFLVASTSHQLEDGGGRMSGRQSVLIK